MMSRFAPGASRGDTMAGARGLGRGLDVLLKGATVDRDHPEVTVIRLEDVVPNPRQPRLEFDPQALEDLAASIKAQGVLQPILVRPAKGASHGYELVAGERRLRASKLAGLTEIPALVREVTDEQSLALALIENLQRENLNALEEAKGLDQLIGTFNMSQEALAQKVGKSRSAVANSLRLLQLPQAIQESLFKDGISAGHARALLSVTQEAAQDALWRRVVERGLSVRETEELAAYWKEHGTLPESVPAQPGDMVKTSSRKKHSLPQELTNLQGKLQDMFKSKVKIGGDGQRGKITFNYTSPDELAALVALWGLGDE